MPIQVRDGRLLDEGRPAVLRSGELHYARIPREYWRHRLELLRAMGLNTVCTYLFWNHHERAPGDYDFTGERDVSHFCALAAELGLWVVVRPGPYSCAEWDWGGIPPRLLAHADLAVRSSDPRYLEPALDWLRAVCRELTPLQVTRGGPLVLVQVENEYGAFGCDKTYLRALANQLREGGFDVPLVRCDWTYPPMMTAGAVDDVDMVANFGADAQGHLTRLRNAFPERPMMCGEFWTGWFDSFGSPRNGGDPAAQARQFVDLEWMLANDISFSLYMLHGGTSFGLWAGANAQEGFFKPYVSSYDFNAPVSEQGQIAERYHAFRELIGRYTPGSPLREPPPAIPCRALPRFSLRETAPLIGSHTLQQQGVNVQTFEALGQAGGLILYRTDLAGRTCGRERLRVKNVHDFALVYLNGSLVGSLDRRLGQIELELDVPSEGKATLEVLVEAMGHINFGAEMANDRKGITQRVEHGWVTLTQWTFEHHPLTTVQLARLRFGEPVASGRPAFYRGRFHVLERADTHLDLSEWGKGHVWVNGKHLGRFWAIGPQQTLYLPAPWQRPGENEVIVLDLLNRPREEHTLCGRNQPVLDRLADVK